ncbi:MAG: DUF4249 domain-containing protein [Bacteroidia bacterium]|nr:DUF4249 domain-containing protein [Bacteroidia bacterium]
MGQLRIIIKLLLLSMMVVSCTERIDIKLDENYTRLVVDGSISTETMAHKVVLSMTSDYFYNMPPEMVTGASVTITDGVFIQVLTEGLPGVYSTDPTYFGEVGHTYTLNIILADPIGGYTDYTASSTLMPVASVDSIGLELHDEWAQYIYWEVKCYLQDPPTTDYYRCKISKNSQMITDTLIEWYVTDDKYFNGYYIDGAAIGYLEQSYADEFLAAGDTITAEINGIEKEYATFIWDAQVELWGSNPLFSGPRANIKGNISNGAIGYFAAYSITRATVIAPEYK